MQSSREVGHVHLEMSVIERLPQIPVAVLLERIQVHPHGSGEEDRILRDDRETRSEFPKAQKADVLAVDVDGATRGLDDSEQG